MHGREGHGQGGLQPSRRCPAKKTAPRHDRGQGAPAAAGQTVNKATVSAAGDVAPANNRGMAAVTVADARPPPRHRVPVRGARAARLRW